MIYANDSQKPTRADKHSRKNDAALSKNYNSGKRELPTLKSYVAVLPLCKGRSTSYSQNTRRWKTANVTIRKRGRAFLIYWQGATTRPTRACRTADISPRWRQLNRPGWGIPTHLRRRRPQP